jgi:hypothetical protein
MTAKNFLLHYVGSGLYSSQDFIAEATKLGVNRAFPVWLVKQAKIEFGIPILLATWEADPTLCVPVDPAKSKAKHPENARKKQGYATIFGYFTVDGISVAGDSLIKDNLKGKLNAVEKQIVPLEVVRECGSYTIYSIVETGQDLKDILKAFDETQKEIGGAKIFLSGKFQPLTPVKIGPTGFSRAGAVAGLDEAMIRAGQVDTIRRIAFLGEYERRTYVPKVEREAKAIGATAPQSF